MAFELARNLLKAIVEEHYSDDVPDITTGYLVRTKYLCEVLDIGNRFFMECLWWGVNHHQVNYVLTYFEAKAELAEKNGERYRVVPEDFAYFRNPPAAEEEEKKCRCSQ